MKTIKLSIVLLQIILGLNLFAQTTVEIIPDLSKANDPAVWTLLDRELKIDDGVYLNAENSSGYLKLNDLNFSNGTIELDIKGKDVRGKSFVGIALHGLNDSVYDVIYFRPFNFKSPERFGHSVQYVSEPEYPWHVLREKFPEKYENPVVPVPKPNEWFHVTIIVEYPIVKVFVNDSKEASLVVTQISKRKIGWLGFWVGYGSDGWFRNLKVTVIEE